MKQTFNSEFAKKYGIEETILIEFFNNELKKSDSKYVGYLDGKKGVRIMLKDLNRIFPYMTQRSIQMALYHLRDIGAIYAKRDAILCYVFSDELKKDIKTYYEED